MTITQDARAPTVDVLGSRSRFDMNPMNNSIASKFTSITGNFGKKVVLSQGGDSAKNLRLTASKESLPNNSNVLLDI